MPRMFESNHVSTSAHILRIFKECDITRGDLTRSGGTLLEGSTLIFEP
jgi:hypothetical protein